MAVTVAVAIELIELNKDPEAVDVVSADLEITADKLGIVE